MRKHMVIFAFMFTAYLILTTTPNIKALELNDQDYATLRNVFTEARIATMSDEEIAKYLSYNLDNAISNEKYFEVIETSNGIINREIPAEEAPDFDIAPLVSDSYETNYKRIMISQSDTGDNVYYVSFTTQWKVTPNVKSYDVNAIRIEDGSPVNGTQTGLQIYWTSTTGTYNHVSYAADGTNILKKSNGFGISMNLVDDASYFETNIDGLFETTSQYAKVYGSYQHAIRSVTLAQSHSYTLSHNGYGKVVNFTSSVQSYYDGMQGVSVALGYTA